MFCLCYFGADFSDLTDWDLLTSFAFDLDFFGARAFVYFLTDLDFDFFVAFAPLALFAGLEDLVGEAAARDLAGEVFLEAVFSLAYSNSASSFLADCRPARLAPEAATADFFAVDWEAFLCDFLTGEADFLTGDGDFLVGDADLLDLGEALGYDFAGDDFLDADFCFFAVDFKGDFVGETLTSVC